MIHIPSILLSQDGISIASAPQKVNFVDRFALSKSGQTLNVGQYLLDRQTIYTVNYWFTVAGTRYFPLMELGDGGSADIGFYRMYFQAGIFSDLCVVANVNAGGAGNFSARLIVDGVATSLLATSTPSTGWVIAKDNTTQITITDGQYVCIEMIQDGSTYNETMIAIRYRPLV